MPHAGILPSTHNRWDIFVYLGVRYFLVDGENDNGDPLLWLYLHKDDGGPQFLILNGLLKDESGLEYWHQPKVTVNNYQLIISAINFTEGKLLTRVIE